MKVLALEPYYGGSHRAFLDGWIKHSRHDWTVLTLPASKWKWRMRHGAVTLADEIGARVAAGRTWDLIFCSDMLNLAEFKGLVPRQLRHLPAVAYFHENQLTYPVRRPDERDDHFVITNLTTALAADRVWFNSDYHRLSFIKALPVFLEKMPDYNSPEMAARIEKKAQVYPPGIEKPPPRPDRQPGPLHILWAARWEHDKNPETFFYALRLLKQHQTAFCISIIGQSFRQAPPVFAKARELFKAEIVNWGYQKTREEYIRVLHQADVLVSTADHEFFGIAVIEALAAGVYPLVPKRLAYPELLGGNTQSGKYFYDGSAEHLAARLQELSGRVGQKSFEKNEASQLKRLVEPHFWNHRALQMDQALNELTQS